MESNSSIRSRKLLPPPLCLPEVNETKEEDRFQINSHEQNDQNRPGKSCCLSSSSSSSENCSHAMKPYTLPVSQRSKVLNILINSSSVLLVQPTFENKTKRFSSTISATRLNQLKQYRPSSQVTISDTEWTDFMRLIIQKPLECELKSLLDKYKTDYFDRVNAPNTNDDTIRTGLCNIVLEILNTYVSNSTGSFVSSPLSTLDNAAANQLCASTSINMKNGNLKRKRKHSNTKLSNISHINNETKFVISYIVPGKYDHSNYRTVNHQQKRQFQKNYDSLFKYIPDQYEEEYLTSKGYLRNGAPVTSNSRNTNICLMLYDEVLNNIEEDDLELSGISLANSFALPQTILERIRSSIQ